MMTAVAIFWPVSFADLWFLELWPSLLWAVAIGLASTYRGWKGGCFTLCLALLPIAAGSIYFGISHASDESFLVAGVIPWSDAAMHFRQAAQMALYGLTQTGMNGRFLYPAYFSSLLNWSHCNLLLAEALGGFFFAGSLVVALRSVACFIGAPGASIVALVCWLFFRARCSGLIMTENLGITCGLLSLAAFLIAIKRKDYWVFLLGVFMLALGLCARPGALVVLPLLVFFAGWIGWQGWIKGIFHPIVKALLAAVLALFVVVAAFSCNTVLSRTLYEGKVITNGNFSFTLYGMLTGGKWSDNLAWSHWDSSLVMHENVRLIQEKPQLLFIGAARAYKEALYRRILFMFNHESRLATLLLILAAVGLIALWKKESLWPYALWLTMIACGILLSIPFAPPWDAAERPFAATVPFQGLLAGVGFFALLQHVAKKLKLIITPSVTEGGDLFFVSLLAMIIFFLTVPLPLLHQMTITPLLKNNTDSSIALRAGSFLVVTPENSRELRQRMIPFLAHYPSEVEFFAKLPNQVMLGIDWESKNFDRCALFSDIKETVSFKGWRVDQRLLQSYF